MQVAAILGPSASERHLAAFYAPGIELQPTGTLAPEHRAALVLGGDGTIHRHLTALAAWKIPVLMVPMGSGNDFARALAVNTLARSLAAWKKFTVGTPLTRDVDLGVVRSGGQQKFFCCVGGAGLDAEANRRANAMPRWLRSRGGYVLAAVSAVCSFQPQTFTVEALPAASPRERIAERAYLVAFANAPAYGGGMRIAPRAQLDDGKLDVCIVAAASKLRILRLLPTVFSGTHISSPEVKYFQTDGLRLETETPLDVYADGEYVCRTPVEVTVAPRSLRVIVP